MELYFPDHPECEDRREHIPAGAFVCENWRTAFRCALSDERAEPNTEQKAVIYKLEAEPEDVTTGKLITMVGSRGSAFHKLVVSRPIVSVLEIDVEAWLLNATQAVLSNTMRDDEETVTEVLKRMLLEEPLMTVSQTGRVVIVPANAPLDPIAQLVRSGPGVGRKPRRPTSFLSTPQRGRWIRN